MQYNEAEIYASYYELGWYISKPTYAHMLFVYLSPDLKWCGVIKYYKTKEEAEEILLKWEKTIP